MAAERFADRYSRQVRFAPIGAAGQARLRAARVAVVGVGALGTVVAEQLARAGVGLLRLIDRDFVEPSNLNRQSLYDEADARACLPKAVAAARRLALINAEVALEPLVAEVGPRSAERLLAGVDLVLDGGDSFRLRHLVNEACCRSRIPWVYGACVGAYGCSLPITPGQGPCLACLQDVLPDAGDTPTCDTAGIIAPAAHLVAAWQVAEALKLLTGAAPRRELWACDLWAGRFQRLALADARDPACRACGERADFPYLSAPADPTVVLCGREAVQVTRAQPCDLAALAARVQAALANDHLVRWHDGETQLTAFRDGRVVVQGVTTPEAARALVDRWLG